jgi:dihydropteroate synthase
MYLQLGPHAYDVSHRPVVVGILNRTRDSFYDRGRLFALEALLRAAEQMAGDGADVLEVGCRPGGVGVRPVSPAEETDLACETLEKLRASLDLPLAVSRRPPSRPARCSAMT